MICRFDTWVVVDAAHMPPGFKFSTNHTPTLAASGGNMKLSVSEVGVLFFPPPDCVCCAAGMPGACNYDPLIRVGNFPQEASVAFGLAWQRKAAKCGRFNKKSEMKVRREGGWRSAAVHPGRGAANEPLRRGSVVLCGLN